MSLRRLLNIVQAYWFRKVPLHQIDEFEAKMNGTYVPKPGEAPPPRTGPIPVSNADLDALDRLKQGEIEPNI